MLLPSEEDGYEIVKVPESYRPEKKINLYSGSDSSTDYQMPQADPELKGQKLEGSGDLPPIKPE